MSREILFKAKRKDNGEWVEGYYVCVDYLKTHHIVKPEIEFDKYRDLYSQRMVEYEVDQNTICQYTGKSDKNGKKVFENDILKGFQYPFLFEGNYNYFASVIWFEDVSAFGTYTFKNPQSKVRGISEGDTSYLGEWDNDDWEVIGNIFDNPELTGGAS